MAQQSGSPGREMTKDEQRLCAEILSSKHILGKINGLCLFGKVSVSMQEYAEAYHRERVKEGNEIAESLAIWSMRYPRDRTYGGSNDKMDGELIAIEERAKSWLKSKLTEK